MSDDLNITAPEQIFNALGETVQQFDNDVFKCVYVIAVFLSKLPKPETPYEQAIMYRKLVGME